MKYMTMKNHLVNMIQSAVVMFCGVSGEPIRLMIVFASTTLCIALPFHIVKKNTQNIMMYPGDTALRKPISDIKYTD